MKPITHRPTPTFGAKCAVCATHARPQFVPWHQHAVGCAVRAADLEQRQLTLRPPAGTMSGLVAF